VCGGDEEEGIGTRESVDGKGDGNGVAGTKVFVTRSVVGTGTTVVGNKVVGDGVGTTGYTEHASVSPHISSITSTVALNASSSNVGKE
jgi:hypothetical protein